jgi:hypothetical protein
VVSTVILDEERGGRKMNEKKNPTGDWFHIDVANAEQRLRSCEACAGDSGEEAGAVVVLCAFEILVCFECLRKFSESLRMFLCNETGEG